MEVEVTTGAVIPVKSSPPTNQHPVSFTGRMPFLSTSQQCQSTEGENITFHGLAYPKLTWGLPTLFLTTNSSWLPWRRVAMPLISPLMPVPLSVCLSLCLSVSLCGMCVYVPLHEKLMMIGHGVSKCGTICET